MALLELLSPAGSFESVAAAVQNGADAIYLGLSDYNARRNAKNLTLEEFQTTLEYCHLRGVLVYVTLNTLLTDRELIEAATFVDRINRLGADAVLVQDLGVLHMVKMVAPDLPVHASTQMSVHNLDGVKRAAEMGISRVVLARELSKDQIAYICSNSPIETEVFVHGSMCMCHSGQCYMSSVIGRRSGNRGLCAQPCRLPYGFSGSADEYPLSLKDMSLAARLNELSEMGVTAVKIEGRMKRPEYTAIVTRVYSDAIKNNTPPGPAELAALAAAFSRSGFTEGYYKGELGPGMFGTREEDAPATEKLFATARRTYMEGSERQRVGVKFYCLLRKFQPAMLAAEDPQGRRVTVEGPIVEEAYGRPLVEAEVKTQLYKTGGTPYYCELVRSHVDQGISIPLSAINQMRREALSRLSEERIKPKERSSDVFKPGLKYLNRKERPVMNLQVTKAEQLHPDLMPFAPYVTYVPVWEIANSPERVKPFIDAGLEICAVLPRVILDREVPVVSDMLKKAKALGVREALVSNIGHIDLAKRHGMLLRGDFGLNAYNSQTIKELKRTGFSSVTASFELSFPQIRDLSKGMDVEIIAYGRLPLMLTENCIIKNHYTQHACENKVELKDRTGALFPVVPEFNCRNVIYNSRKLFLADKSDDYERLGLWGIRLLFTTENPRECVQTVERYAHQGKYEPNSFTRGLYYRGVE